MNWTEDDYMNPEQEREIEAREECARRGIDPDEICADGGVTAWMVVDKALRCAPRRCDTNYVGGSGECLECDADQGEYCRHPKSDDTLNDIAAENEFARDDEFNSPSEGDDE